jgi:hypothetical protein
MVLGFDCLLVLGPEHARVFSRAGWDKEKLKAELHRHLTFSGADLVRGADGISEGMPEAVKSATLPKFRPGGLHIVHAGGRAGLFSCIIGGWVGGEMGSQTVIREIVT